MRGQDGDFSARGNKPSSPPTPHPNSPKKRHLLSLFIGTLSTPASLCVKMRAGIQKTCTDGASSLSASSSPPSRSFRSSTGAQAQRQLGFFLLHTSSRSLSSLPPSPPSSPPSFPPPVIGEAGARRQTVLFLQRIDLTSPQLRFASTERASQVLFLQRIKSIPLAGRKKAQGCRLVLME